MHTTPHSRPDRPDARSTRRWLAAAIATALCWAATGALAFSGGPLDGHTGAPGENDCTACHSTFPLNSGSGSLGLGGIDAYQPGEAYVLELTLSDSDAMRWGFEFTILDELGVSAGDLAPVDGNTQTSVTGDRTYVKHTSAGTAPGTSGSRTWQVQWTAPAAGTGDLTLYAAGNAANNNNANTGDRIYTASFVVPEGEPTPAVGLPVLARLLPNHPNPFNPLTSIRFELGRSGQVRLVVFAVDGRHVRTLVDGPRNAGVYTVHWDGRDQRGRALPSGTYLYELKTPFGSEARRMTLAR